MQPSSRSHGIYYIQIVNYYRDFMFNVYLVVTARMYIYYLQCFMFSDDMYKILYYCVHCHSYVLLHVPLYC